MSAHDLASRRAYLAGRRWFVQSDREVEQVEPLAWSRSCDDGFGVRVELVRVRTGDGGARTYQVPASYRRDEVPELAGALMAVEDGWHVYDALLDAHARSALLVGFTGARPEGQVFHDEGLHLDPDVVTVPLVAEQSNTSTIVDHRLLWKLFRIVGHGANPDVEVGRALTRTGSTAIAPVRGWVSAGDVDLAMLYDYFATATDGWDSARASVRDLMAGESDDPAAAGADLAQESARLGQAVAQVHELMADLGHEEVAPSVVAARLRARFSRTTSAARWGERADAVFAELAALDEPVRVQRVHGDLHLGQVLRSVEGWRVFDFEGEPAAPLVERRAFDSPLRDVAGMLRSFDYAPHSVLMQTGLAPRPGAAEAWTRRNSEAFLEGYGVRPGTAAFVLLRCYQVDKAAYEVDYETTHRPGWASIPADALERLLT